MKLQNSLRRFGVPAPIVKPLLFLSQTSDQISLKLKLFLTPRRLRFFTFSTCLFFLILGGLLVTYNRELSELENRIRKQSTLDRCFIGGHAPEIIGKTQFNQTWSLAGCRGKVVVVDFTADACVHCGPAHQMLESLENEFKRDDLVFVSISVDDSLERRDRAIRRRNIHWPVIWDESNGDAEHPISSRYKVFELPSIWIIGKDGKVMDANALRFRPFLRSTISKSLNN